MNGVYGLHYSNTRTDADGFDLNLSVSPKFAIPISVCLPSMLHEEQNKKASCKPHLFKKCFFPLVTMQRAIIRSKRRCSRRRLCDCDLRVRFVPVLCAAAVLLTGRAWHRLWQAFAISKHSSTSLGCDFLNGAL